MKCSKCGAEFEGKFCPECGAPVEQIPDPKKKKKGGCLKFGLIAVGAIVVIGVIANLAGGNGGKSPSSSAVPATAKSAETSPSKETVSSGDKASSAKPDAGKAQYFSAGMYKVGTDLPAGEYVLIADSSSYFQVSKDSTGSLDSVISNDNFSGRSIITVKEGQYLTVTGAKIYKIAEAPAVDISSGTLPEGMYKVGADIKAGEYKVHPTGSMSYCEVATNSSHTLDSIISNDNFTADKYITVKDGQYLKLSGAELVLK